MGKDDSWDGARDEYWEYFMAIRDQLPPRLIALEEDFTLHDAVVHSTSHNEAARQLIMVLDGWDRRLNEPLRYTLTFLDVGDFEQKLARPDQRLSELDDLGYYEVELFGSVIQLRMLFASSAELSVTFSDFDFEIEDR